MGKARGENRILTTVVISMMAILFAVMLLSGTVVNAEESFTTTVAAGEYMKQHMMARDTVVKFTYTTKISASASQDEVKKAAKSVLSDIYDTAMADSNEPAGGDYLRNSIFSRNASISASQLGEDLTVTYTVKLVYFDNADQQKAFISAANKVAADLQFEGKSDYEKVKAIYTYIVKNVSYDRKNMADSTYLLKHSSYAALINKTSVCQGYATLFYYLAETAGLDSRIVLGNSYDKAGSQGEDHAWNIVKIDGKYYYVDSTWDAGNSYANYFLKGDSDFANHANYAINDGDKLVSIYSKYSMAYKSYFETNKVKTTDISNAKVTVENAVYNGKSITSDVTVVLDGKTLVQGIDYTVKYLVYYYNEKTCDLQVNGIGEYSSFIKMNSPVKTTFDDKKTDDASTEKAVSSSQASKADNTVTVTDGNAVTASGETVSLQKDMVVICGNYKYKVTSVNGKSGAVTLIGTTKKLSKASVPATIKCGNITFKVTAIGSGAFKNNKSLKSVTIGKNVKTIGSKAFYGCKNLKTIKVKSSGIKKIGSKAFKSVNSKAKVSVPGKVISSYKKMMKKAGLAKTAKVKK